MFTVPEKHRVKTGQWGSDESYGNNGVFSFGMKKGKKKVQAFAVVSDQADWEHVSISLPSSGRTPTWEEMNHIKGMFWGEEDCVVQYHPPKSEYVNCHPYTLHLWRPVDKEMPAPPSILVGPK